MAISANTVWEVESGGATTNSGGFVTGASGTDWSKQVAPQYSLTNGVTNGTTIIATISAVADMIGNLVYVSGGTGSVAANWYQITAQSLGVSITVDRSTGLTAGTGVTLNIGGAFPSIGQVGATALLATAHTIYVKQATYSFSTASTNVNNGFLSDSLTYVIIGYNTNRNYFNTDTRPIFQWGASTLNGIASRSVVVNIEFDGNSQTAAKGYNGFEQYIRCIFRNMNTASTAICSFIDCSATTNSAIIFGIGALCWGCEAYANTATPYGCTTATNCLGYGNTGASTDGFAFNVNDSVYSNCDAYSNGRDGFRWGSAARPCTAINCHSESHSAGYGFNPDAGTSPHGNPIINCSAYNNASGTVNLGVRNIYNAGFITVTAGSVYTNAAGNDFSKNSTANQGALLRGTGDPLTFPRGTTASTRDIGAAQHADPAGSGGNTILAGSGQGLVIS